MGNAVCLGDINGKCCRCDDINFLPIIIKLMIAQRLDLSYEDYLKNGRSIADSSIDKYIIYEKLDSGAFGSVYRGMHRQTGKEVAIKVIDLLAIERDECSERVKEIKRRLAKTESEMMVKINSDHVMKCYATYENECLKIMVIEYCNGGNLSEEIYKRKRIPEVDAVEILKQIITGLSAMHEVNIVHRDLKADNIMSHNGIYKIVDLGFAKMIPRGPDCYNTSLGTIITMAPEVMRKQKYGLKADIWSIGIIFYEMVYGRIPYEPMKSADMYEQIIKKDIFPNNGKVFGFRPCDAVLNLMKKILVIDQRKRMDWEQLISLQVLSPSKSLPDQYRITTNIKNLNKTGEIAIRNDNDIILALPELQDTKKENVKIAKLSKKEKENMIDKMDRSEDKILTWARQTHLECLKTELILKEIINPIEMENIFPLNNRKVVEMMYLLSARCFFNMSFVMDKLENEDHAIVQNLKRTVHDLYQAVTKKFNEYSQLLTEQENKMGSIIGDRINKIFKNSQIKEKDMFLGGIENSEFSKEDQIKFTFEKYLCPLLEEGKVEAGRSIHNYMKNYLSISMIQLSHLKNMKFADRVQDILK